MDDGQPPHFHLTLLLDLDRREPLGGRIGPLEGRLRPFSGWIGLAQAINECLGSTELAVADLDVEDLKR
ncbi:MAG: hypothetical protein M3065_18460 [Actinomycetota bacterium]|nr:hypothetical protein [Actinomycetota bacterium]